MKKYLLLLLMTGTMSAMEVVDSHQVESEVHSLEDKTIILNCTAATDNSNMPCVQVATDYAESDNAIRHPLPSLLKICIYEILMRPREYIKRDGQNKLSSNMQNIIREEWYNNEARGRLTHEDHPYGAQDSSPYYFSNDFLSKRIPLAQLLLLRARSIVEEENKGKKLMLTSQEKEIFEGMHPALQEEIKPHIKKSLVAEIYDILLT